jgi:2,4-dienoyl-CoA reductase-like NADH-dependent reductase (Old Yellow Enzyme family)
MPEADFSDEFKQLKNTAICTPFKLDAIQLEHRIVQVPLTRTRSMKESECVTVPSDLNIEYYSQRTTKGGL